RKYYRFLESETALEIRFIRYESVAQAKEEVLQAIANVNVNVNVKLKERDDVAIFQQIEVWIEKNSMNTPILLSGGQNAACVLRIGDYIHRSRAANHQFIHPLLRHLAQNRFPFSPRLIGSDNEGRTILSFIKGEVPRDIVLTMEHKITAIKIMRKFHDVCANSEFAETQETVCHNDFAPWNIIVKDNKVVGIIDFDDIAPGNRIDDVAYFLWTFLDLGTSSNSTKTQIEQLTILAKAYGLTSTRDLAAALLRQQQRILIFRQQRLAKAKNEDEAVELQIPVTNIQRSIEWVESNQKLIKSTVV
ncbi:MAG: phosphotransferase, partial [Saprospiraceae bacterium]